MNVGQRVRVICQSFAKGLVGTVERIDRGVAYVELAGKGGGYPFTFDELEALDELRGTTAAQDRAAAAALFDRDKLPCDGEIVGFFEALNETATALTASAKGLVAEAFMRGFKAGFEAGKKAPR